MGLLEFIYPSDSSLLCPAPITYPSILWQPVYLAVVPEILNHKTWVQIQVWTHTNCEIWIKLVNFHVLDFYICKMWLVIVHIVICHMTTFQSIIDYIKKLNKWRDIPYSWIGRLNIVNIVKTQKFIPTLSIDTIQPQSKSQQVILWISTDSNQHNIEGLKFKSSRLIIKLQYSRVLYWWKNRKIDQRKMYMSSESRNRPT